MGLSGSLVCGARAVPLDHPPAWPTGEPHQVVLAATLAAPTVSDRVPEPVRVHIRYPGLDASMLQKLSDPRVRELASTADPEIRQTFVLMLASNPEIAPQGLRRAVPEHGHPVPAPLPEHRNAECLEVQFGRLDADQLRATHPSVEQEPHDRGIPSVLEPGT
jgi:hypothetical protein